MRTVDKTKKSNIKCEHCEHWCSLNGLCEVYNKQMNYWNRCPYFTWHHRYNQPKGELEA